MRLDVYMPPSHVPETPASGGEAAAPPGLRSRKHSTLFADGFAAGQGATPQDHARGFGAKRAAVIVFLPSTIPPLTWTGKRVRVGV